MENGDMDNNIVKRTTDGRTDIRHTDSEYKE